MCIALGARRRDVFRDVLGEALGAAVIGEVMSLDLTGVAASALEGVRPTDMSTHLPGRGYLARSGHTRLLPAVGVGVPRRPDRALRHD